MNLRRRLGKGLKGFLERAWHWWTRNYPRMLAQNLWHLPVICNYFNLVTILQSISFPPSLIFTVANLVLVAALQGFVATELNRVTFLQRINSKELFKRKKCYCNNPNLCVTFDWLSRKTNASFLSKGETEKNRPLHNFLPLVPPSDILKSLEL